MGFRDLHAHNMALLAKQAWRLISEPHSLIAHIYQAKYFPSGDFWSGTLTSSPSSCWRGILEARGILLKVLHWQVGEGCFHSHLG